MRLELQKLSARTIYCHVSQLFKSVGECLGESGGGQGAVTLLWFSSWGLGIGLPCPPSHYCVPRDGQADRQVVPQQ